MDLGTIFQFTVSYEADLTLQFPDGMLLSFNSQPHTRLTGYRLGVDCRIAFQFTASYEADREEFRQVLPRMSFQFTASYEADHK